LFLGRCQVELLNDVHIVDILLANLLDGVVDTLSDVRVLAFLYGFEKVDNLLGGRQFLIEIERNFGSVLGSLHS